MRGGAGLAATFATGGGAAAKAAVTGASALAGLTTAERVSKVIDTLGRTGGFPHSSLANILGNISQIGENADSFRGRIAGIGDWSRDERSGKIDFSKEKYILGSLRKLPRDLSIMDLLHDDVIGSQVKKDKESTDDDGFSLFGPGYDESVSLEEVQKIRQFLEPLCGQDTTVGDLIGQFEGFFVRLAKHAISNPADIEDVDSDMGMLSLLRPNRLQDLIKITKRNKSADPAVLEQLERTEAKVSAIAEENRKLRSQAREKELKAERAEWEAKQAEELEKIKSDMDYRNGYEVSLISAGEDSFVLHIGQGREIPTRADWLQWLQTIDPEAANPSQIELGHMGLTITIKNEKALQNIAESKDGSDDLMPRAHITLPNRRMAANLYGEDDRFSMRRRFMHRSSLLDYTPFSDRHPYQDDIALTMERFLGIRSPKRMAENFAAAKDKDVVTSALEDAVADIPDSLKPSDLFKPK